MATFTRKQLRTRQTDTADFTDGGARNFSLVNNSDTTAYFSMEGKVFLGSQVELFKSTSISSPVNCSLISSSTVAGFIINPNLTATFTFTPSEFIPSQSVDFFAPNVLDFHLEDNTQSGSAFGVNLDTDA